MIADLADILDQRMIHHRLDEFVVVVLIGAIDLCRDLERNAASDSNLDCAVDAFLRCDPAQHSEIAWFGRLRRQQLFRKPMVDRAQPVRLRDRTALRVGDRDHRDR